MLNPNTLLETAFKYDIPLSDISYYGSRYINGKGNDLDLLVRKTDKSSMLVEKLFSDNFNESTNGQDYIGVFKSLYNDDLNIIVKNDNEYLCDSNTSRTAMLMNKYKLDLTRKEHRIFLHTRNRIVSSHQTTKLTERTSHSLMNGMMADFFVNTENAWGDAVYCYKSVDEFKDYINDAFTNYCAVSIEDAIMYINLVPEPNERIYDSIVHRTLKHQTHNIGYDLLTLIYCVECLGGVDEDLVAQIDPTLSVYEEMFV